MGLCLLNSCRCDCTCEKKVGCEILTAKLNSNGHIIQTKTICSETNMLNQDFQDSVTAFKQRYQTDSTSVFTQDSIFKDDIIKKLSCDQSKPYENKGYNCSCLK